MRINPILMTNFSIRNRINNNQNKISTPVSKPSDDKDSFTLSFGELEGGPENKRFDFKKEYKEIKNLLKNRSDFTLHEKRAIAGTIKYEYGFEKLVLSGKKQEKDKAKQIFDDKMRKYTDLTKEMISRKRFSAHTIVRIMRIDLGAENLDIEKLLIKNKNFPPKRIVPFMTSAAKNKCDYDKMKEMLEDGIFSEERLIEETKRKK